MDKKRQTELSKFLSYVLRHCPEALELTLDDGGWVKISDLIERVQVRFPDLDATVLNDIVRSDSKQRYAISDGRIRAQQGHSIDVGAVASAKTPPDILYHGTTIENWKAIQKSGAIVPMSRTQVHLSTGPDTARQVAARRSAKKHVILVIRASAMSSAGYEFMVSGNGVWLADKVPFAFVEIFDKKSESRRRD